MSSSWTTIILRSEFILMLIELVSKGTLNS